MTGREVDTTALVRLAALLATRPADLVVAVEDAAGPDLEAVLESPDRLRRVTVGAALTMRPVTAAEAEPTWPELRPEQTDLVRRWTELAPLNRAVLALVEVERVPRGEVAAVLDRPVATVNKVLTETLAALDADPSELAAVLSVVSSRTIDPAERRRAERRRTERRRSRSRRRVLIGATALVVVAALVLPGLLNRTTPAAIWVRGHRDWVLSFRLQPPPGWDVTTRTVAADVETTQVERTGSGTGLCQITVGQIVVGQIPVGQAGTSPTVDPPPSAPGSASRTRTVRVHDRAGRLTSSTDRAELSWALDDTAAADVACSGIGDAGSFVTALAAAMVFEAQPISLPYRVQALPDHFHVDQVTVYPQRDVTVVNLWPDEVTDASVALALVQTMGSASGFEIPTLDAADQTRPSTCRLVGEVSVCVDVADSGSSTSALELDRTNRRLQVVQAGVTLAASSSDRSTWFDARDALPAI